MEKREKVWKVGTLLALLAALGFAWTSLAGKSCASRQKAPVPELGKEIISLQDSFVSVAESVKPAVVQITTEKTVTLRYWDPFGNMGNFFQNPFKDFFDSPEREKPREYKQKQKGLGSGFIVDKEGYILTNNHVIANVDTIKVKLLGEDKPIPAKVIGKDSRTDVALIKIRPPRKGLSVVKLGDSDKIRIGEWAIAIGNPFGLEETVTVGVVSAKGRRGFGITPYEDFIQTDASINPGNSGGPLVNIKGEVIGINTFIMSPNIAQGIGFAIPINMAKDIFSQLKEKGKVVRGWLGIVIQPLHEDLAKSFGISSEEGVLVGDILHNSPAEKCGLKKGDVIVELNGKKITKPTELQKEVARIKPDTNVSLKIIRDKKTLSLKIKLGEMPREEEMAEKEPEKKERWRGLSVQNITPEIKERFDLKDVQGVIIANVEPGSPADEAGLSQGFIIIEINQQMVTDTSDYYRIIGGIKENQDVILSVSDGKTSHYVILKGE